jgi:transcription elongation factor SPT5
MATSNLINAQFDESDEEDDNFNPQPADLSDAEDAGGDHDEDAGDQIRREAARQESKDDASEGEDTAIKEDEEGEGEDTAPGDEEEEDEEEEDEEDEEITVRLGRVLEPAVKPAIRYRVLTSI